MRAALVLICGLAFSACAQAAPPGGEASRSMPRLSASDTIELCLTASQNRGQGEACILEYASNCISLAGDLPTAAIRETCYGEEREAWMARQAASLASLVDAMSVERRGLLMESQDAWSAAVQRDCDFVASFYPHAPVAQAQGAQCLAERSAHRALQLRDWVEAYTR